MHLRVSLFLIILVVLQACSSSKPTAKTSGGKGGSTAKGELSEQEQMNFTFNYVEASREKMQGNAETAARHYKECIKIDPTNPAPIYEMSVLMDQAGSTQPAVELAAKAVELDGENIWFRKHYAGLLLKVGEFAASATQFEKLVKTDPENVDYLFDWAYVLIYDNQFSEAIKAYDKIESLVGLDPEISIQKHRVYLQQGKTEEARKELERVIERYPDDLFTYRQLAEMYKKLGDTENEIKVYERIIEIDPSDGTVHLQLADYYEKAGDRPRSHEELKKAFRSEQVDIDTKAKILLNYYGVTESNRDPLEFAYELATIFTETHPKDARPYSLLADFQYRDNKLKEARENYRKAVKHDEGKFIIWNQILILDSQLNDFESMLTESETSMELFPAQPAFYLFNGTARQQQKDYEGAIESLETGKSLVIENNPLLQQFYSNLGAAYHALEQHEESDEAYEAALELNPNDVFVLNNYGYYLALRKKSLDKAESMSLKANELQPGQPSFQDTYGYILYSNEKYEEALKWLQKAMDSGGKNNGEILEHYGDALFQLGRKEEAFDYWNKARDAGGASQVIDKKIENKQLYE